MKRPAIRSIWRPQQGTLIINNRTLSVGRVERLSDILPRELRHAIPDSYATVRVLDCDGKPHRKRMWNLAHCSPFTIEAYLAKKVVRLVAQAKRWQHRYIRPDQRLSDIGFGSAKTINFVALVQRELGITLPESALRRCVTVGDLVEQVVRRALVKLARQRALKSRPQRTARLWRIVAALHAMQFVREDVVARVADEEARSAD
ncbi:MAG: acyl carrier protein [Candidatus Kerfeldbacteria bacterium]